MPGIPRGAPRPPGPRSRPTLGTGPPGAPSPDARRVRGTLPFAHTLAPRAGGIGRVAPLPARRPILLIRRRGRVDDAVASAPPHRHGTGASARGFGTGLRHGGFGTGASAWGRRVPRGGGAKSPNETANRRRARNGARRSASFGGFARHRRGRRGRISRQVPSPRRPVAGRPVRAGRTDSARAVPRRRVGAPSGRGAGACRRMSGAATRRSRCTPCKTAQAGRCTACRHRSVSAGGLRLSGRARSLHPPLADVPPASSPLPSQGMPWRRAAARSPAARCRARRSGRGRRRRGEASRRGETATGIAAASGFGPAEYGARS